MSVLLTCTEPGSVPGQNCADLEAAVCWLKRDWKDPPMDWVPADKEAEEDEQKGKNIITSVDTACVYYNF